MSRLVPALSFCCVAAIGATAYMMLRGGATATIGVPTQTPVRDGPAADRFAALQAARRTCTKEALDRFVAQLREQVEKLPDDRESWRLLAEGLLERALQRSHLRGMAVGTPLHTELPPETKADLDAGDAALARARELGDDSADSFRIEASLLSQRITGLLAAMQWNGRIEQSLKQAGERRQDDPQLHVALGLRNLLAPPLLGNDPGKALEHFEFAAKALADDERPAVFAAMASYLQKKRQQAIGWLDQAVQRNPHNTFARVVRNRLRAGEDDPFGRDVTAAEAAAR